MLRKLVYIPLEPYENRYTYQLLDWSTRQFKECGITVEVVLGKSLGNTITVGQVLDAFGRPYWAMSQIQELLVKLSNNEFSSDDFIFFEDMFHPGIESLFYAMDQMFYNDRGQYVPHIGMRCLAQTIDPDDFVHYTGMESWMRHYEKMVVERLKVLFVASREMLGYIKSAGWRVKTVVTGLPFCKEEVLGRVGKVVKPFEERPYKIAFASRIAKEKNINFLVNFARRAFAKCNVSTTILSGNKLDKEMIDNDFPRLSEAITVGIIQVKDGLSKNQYYEELQNSRVLFNCSYQDWVSNTASEADTLGCNLLFPAYRSFPEAFNNDHTRMYVPWSIEDAVDKLVPLLENPHNRIGHFAGKQNATNWRTINAIKELFEE